MSKRTTSLILGLLATTEAQISNLDKLKEASENGNLEGYAQQLFSEKYENTSAYERLINSDKQKKMDYLNSIREDAAQANALPTNSPLAQERSNGIPDAVPVQEYSNPLADLPDPSAASIRDRVAQETQRRQNAITEGKRLEAEQREALEKQE